MKKYTIEISDELSIIYEDIAKMNKKNVEDCLSIILERVIHTMLYPPDENPKKQSDLHKKADKQISLSAY